VPSDTFVKCEMRVEIRSRKSIAKVFLIMAVLVWYLRVLACPNRENLPPIAYDNVVEDGGVNET
jgi:hypothetical protein